MKGIVHRRRIDLLARLAASSVTAAQQTQPSTPIQRGIRHCDTSAHRLLTRAGLPLNTSRLRVRVAGGAAGGFLTAIGLMLLATRFDVILTGPSVAALITVLPLIGAAIPLLHLRSLARQRSEALARDLPDALDLLALATAAGLAIDAAIARVAEATRNPLQEELHRWRQDVTLGVSRGQALRDMAERNGVHDIGRWASVMAQAESTGAPLAEVLRSQATMQREHRALRAVERAHRLPVTMVVPLIVCVLPALLIVVIGPAVLSIASSGALP